jgi:hypothetical protein
MRQARNGNRPVFACASQLHGLRSNITPTRGKESCFGNPNIRATSQHHSYRPERFRINGEHTAWRPALSGEQPHSPWIGRA